MPPQPPAPPLQGKGATMVRLQVWVPRVWLERLHELADERAVSMSDVLRIFLRDSLYERPLPWQQRDARREEEAAVKPE